MEPDALAFAIGAILSQKQEGSWHPVAFLSRKLQNGELRYDTPDAEMMAIVESFRQWRHYLAYTQEPVEVLTDHLNHRYLATKPKISSRQARWMEELGVFDFTILYREGKKNPADGLSRRPDLESRGDIDEARRAPLGEFLSRFQGVSLEDSGAAAVVRCLRRQGRLDPEAQSLKFAYALAVRSPGGLRPREITPLEEDRLEARALEPPEWQVRDVVSVAGEADRELYTPWPVTSEVAERLLTAGEQLEPTLAEALLEAQRGDAFVM